MSQSAIEVSENQAIEIIDRVKLVSSVLKTVSHESRLIILCHLVGGPKSVSELQVLISCRQASVSQQLSRLRFENLVVTRRIGKSVYYSLADGKTANLIGALHDIYCDSED
jgi:DNA-binding transcriptional ArsR family regulator